MLGIHTMTDAVISSGPGVWAKLYQGKTLPILTVVFAILVAWYAGAVYLNSDTLISTYERTKVEWNAEKLIKDSWAMERPILPAPHQIVVELNKTVLQKNITSKRSLIYHAWITTSATLLGFAFGGLLGILLAVGIVHVQTLDRSLMPWVIASQTIPILAIFAHVSILTVLALDDSK